MDIKFVKYSIEKFNRRIPLYGDGRYIRCWLDLIWSAACFGCSFDDYFRYEFYRKSSYEKNRFITYWRSRNLIKRYNSSREIVKLLDKRVSNRLFAKFISREWLDTSICKYADFEKFIMKHKTVIVKPVKGSSGMGIFKYCFRKEDNLEEEYRKIKGSLVEEIVKQHGAMSSLNPSSVNTVRVLTFLHERQVNILGCSVKAGTNKSLVDNVCSGGFSAGIDIGTGVVFTSFVGDENFERYLEHPFSGVQIIGFKIPNWEKVLETAKKAALLVVGIRYIGWDIAVLNNGVELIEANHDPGHPLNQINDQVGKYEIVRHILNGR